MSVLCVSHQVGRADTVSHLERREALAKSLDHIANKEVRLAADRNQATPPAAALSTTSGNAPKARKKIGGAGAAKQAQKGLSR